MLPLPVSLAVLTRGCFILSAILNFIILPLAIRSTKYTLETYKIIMLLFSTSNTLYYIPLIPHQMHYFKRYMVVLYIPGSKDWLEDLLLAVALQLFGVIYMTTVFLEALHFIYRYLLLCRLSEVRTF